MSAADASPRLDAQDSPDAGGLVASDNESVERFELQRPRLFGIAYRMLGSVMEAEDAVQEAYLRFSDAKLAEVRSDQAFLTTIVTRLCLDQLKSARSRREVYPGPWLPEPALLDGTLAGSGPERRLEERESITMAFLVLLESLTPTERAIFLLREVFDYPFKEIAAIVDKREDACRQEFHRAKRHVIERRPRYHPSSQELERLTQAFIGALALGDIDGLMRLLADDVTVWSDGGGKVAAARRPVHGRSAVARLWLGLLRKLPGVPSVQVVQINARPAIVVTLSGKLYSIVTIDGDAGEIHTIYSVSNPDKIRHLTGLAEGPATGQESFGLPR